MSVLITDTGFGPLPPAPEPVPFVDREHHQGSVVLASHDDPADLAPYLADLTLIHVDFPVFSDGRGFTIGRRLRMMGYRGHLRAQGHILPDQYAMIRRVGFDDVEISDDLAMRLKEADWRARADWQAHDYQARLRA
jgi:uncharacterized protein (DUF934 family)